jgi:hypothetical protein
VGRAATLLVQHLARPTWLRVGRTVSEPASVVLSQVQKRKTRQQLANEDVSRPAASGAGRSLTPARLRRVSLPHHSSVAGFIVPEVV